MTRNRAWAFLALVVIATARLTTPAAPAIYEGIGPVEPYHYCTPPAHMATVNKPPTSGSGDLLAVGDANQLGSVSTSDNQVLTFFPKASMKSPGSAKYHVSIAATCSNPPPPPAGNTQVGNAYDFSVVGQPGDVAVTFVQPAQVLLRTPPVQYTSVQLFHSGSWHALQWGQQGDIANIQGVNHPGTLAAFDDGSKNAPGKPPDQRSPGIAVIVEVVLLSVAVGIVVVAVVVQRRRGPVEPVAETKVRATPGKRRKK